MGLGSILPAGSVVQVTIGIDALGAARVLGRTSAGLEKTARSARRARTGFVRLRSAVATVTKALLSMVAVLIAFNLLITLPQAIFRGFVTVLKAAILTTSQFEQRILSLQAILASTVRFVNDPVDNFIRAGKVAASVVEVLALKANEMVVSLEEAVIVFQTLVATGAQNMVENMGELVDLTILLSNAIAGITVGQQRQRQLAEETRSLITGQLRSTSLLGRLLFNDTAELKRFNIEMRETKKLSKEIEAKLQGFSLAAKDFAQTFEGLSTTMETFLQLLAKRALGGIFDTTEKQISKIFDQVQESPELFNLLAASLAAAFRIVQDVLKDIISDDLGLRFDSVEDFFLSVIEKIPIMTGKLVTLVLWLRNSIFALLAIIQLVRALIALIPFVLQLLIAIADIGRVLSGEITFKEFTSGIAEKGAEIVRLLNSALTNFNSFVDSQASAIESQQRLLEITALTAIELARIEKEQGDLADLNDAILGTKIVDLSLTIEKNKQLIKTNRLIQREADLVIQVLSLSKTGGLSGVVGIGITPAAGDTIKSLNVQKRIFQDQLKIARADKLRATAKGVLQDPKQIQEITDQIIIMETAIGNTVLKIVALQDAFRNLASTTVDDLARAFSDIAIGGLFEDFFRSFEQGADGFKLDIKAILGSIKEFVQTVQFLLAVVGAIGKALANAITNAFSGLKGFGQTLREIFGSFIIIIGQAIVQLGAAMVAMGVIGAFLGLPGAGELIVAGLKAIAIGAALIGLGTALSGGAGGGGVSAASSGESKVPTFTFDQEQVNVQQAFLEATENLNESSVNFQRATSDLTSMPAGEVVVKGNAEQGGAARILSTDLKKGSSISSGQSIARTLGGN